MTCNYIVIDTNVFEHLFNPQNNTCNHINILLFSLKENKTKILVDQQNNIIIEYNSRLRERIKNADENHETRTIIRFYLINSENHVKISVNCKEPLMRKIKRIIKRPSTSRKYDRIFVYLALKKHCTLITDDQTDIANQRKSLLKIKTNGHRAKKLGARIYTSEEAYNHIIPTPKQSTGEST